MDIYQCEAKARDAAMINKKLTFELKGPNGVLKCSWLDPHFGLIMIEGQSGFTRSDDVRKYMDDLGLVIQNVEWVPE